jgi:hypothetical protein
MKRGPHWEEIQTEKLWEDGGEWRLILIKQKQY